MRASCTSPAPTTSRLTWRLCLVGSAFTSMLLLGCRGGFSGRDGGQGACPTADAGVLRIPGVAAVKVEPTTDGSLLVLSESVNSIVPGRRILSKMTWRGELTFQYVGGIPLDNVIDFAQHPSGEISVALAQESMYSLVRLSPSGQALHRTDIEDVLLEFDPQLIGYKWPEAMDTIRVRAMGEEAVVAARSIANEAILLRYGYSQDGGFLQRWRTLVEPAMTYRWTVTTASFDALEQDTGRFGVFLDLDEGGNAYVAIPASERVVLQHNERLGDTLQWKDATRLLFGDLILTRVSPEGQRVFTRLVGSEREDEFHGLRVMGGSVFLVGRTRVDEDPGNLYDGLIASYDKESGEPRFIQALPFDRGDVLYDLAFGQDGNLIAVGSCGWTQNPQGASVSEASQKLLFLLDREGGVVERKTLPEGPRHNLLRSVTTDGGSVITGGFENGPGTHSGDQDSTQIKADLFVAKIPLDGPAR